MERVSRSKLPLDWTVQHGRYCNCEVSAICGKCETAEGCNPYAKKAAVRGTANLGLPTQCQASLYKDPIKAAGANIRSYRRARSQRILSEATPEAAYITAGKQVHS